MADFWFIGDALAGEVDYWFITCKLILLEDSYVPELYLGPELLSKLFLKLGAELLP